MSDDDWRDVTPITSDYEVQISRTGKARHRPRQKHGRFVYLMDDSTIMEFPWTPGWPGRGLQW